MEFELKPSEFELFKDLIRSTTGIDLDDSKRQLMQGRFRSRIRELNLPSFKAYFDFVVSCGPSSTELTKMINCTTTNKTSFFREFHHFDFLQKKIVLEILKRVAAGAPKKILIWSAACSTGQEPYSIAATLLERLPNASQWEIQIIATDIDTDVLARARDGIYHMSDLGAIPKSVLNNHFDCEDIGAEYEVRPKKHLKDVIEFKQLNFMDEVWNLPRQFDTIFCRNALIYFDRKTKDGVISRFCDLIPEDAYLILGHSESIVHDPRLTALGKTIFCRKSSHVRQTEKKSAADQVVHARVDSRQQKITEEGQASFRPLDVPKQPKQYGRKRIIVGEVFASKQPSLVHTVLGSCVAACLFDEETRIGGMNHFLLPDGRSGRDEASYGIFAMELLINEIMKLGGDRRRLKAKVFGGAHVVASISEKNCVGVQNVDFVRSFLRDEGIPIVAKHVGGEFGMQVVFNTFTAEAKVRHVKKVETVTMPRKVHVSGVPANNTKAVTLFS